MKKKKLIIVVVSIFFLTIGVSAATILYSANNIPYSNSSLAGNNVQDALDNLYNKFETSKTTCPSGMTCTDKTNIKCKRATTLHTENCTNSDTDGYCLASGYASGDTITYGNEKIIHGVLKTGDAFDCDVNGDGTFDATSERFYYVSSYYDTNTKQFNDNYAVLIYYSDVRGGTSSTQATAYSTQSDCQDVGTCTISTGCNWYGPLTAKKELPTTTQWTNVRLYKDIRPILGLENDTSTTGGTLPTAFSYAGYAARLLTYQEVWKGCYSLDTEIIDEGGINTKCQFLMERTKFSDSNLDVYGDWIENAHAEYNNVGAIIYAGTRNINADNDLSTTDYGVRPAIEVLKSEMLY